MKHQIVILNWPITGKPARMAKAKTLQAAQKSARKFADAYPQCVVKIYSV